VIERINALGYGLTLGIQTRIDSRAQALAARAHVGNIYVNRNIIGAVVGVQPFGGEGLSAPAPRRAGRTTCTASAPSRRSRSTPPRPAATPRCCA
jgi:RHH-type proline utilization regulon transcriptional repressor/proline dehydrogenase/delta 1-pyrroline-5-carboxylate dehydrogenase